MLGFKKVKDMTVAEKAELDAQKAERIRNHKGKAARPEVVLDLDSDVEVVIEDAAAKAVRKKKLNAICVKRYRDKKRRVSVLTLTDDGIDKAPSGDEADEVQPDLAPEEAAPRRRGRPKGSMNKRKRMRERENLPPAAPMCRASKKADE